MVGIMVGATHLQTSSRSHSIFSIVVECCDVSQTGEHIRVGKVGRKTGQNGPGRVRVRAAAARSGRKGWSAGRLRGRAVTRERALSAWFASLVSVSVRSAVETERRPPSSRQARGGRRGGTAASVVRRASACRKGWGLGARCRRRPRGSEER